ncbi:CRISPR-associated helicase Cas3' [Roseivirga sp. BDSF3-8]|uniref:CRISPR-associated helicase Cas3' n=1 Tax=Roseivirga sp. BDSF3-8 TaxID=3241598 RepID=UPI003531DAA5
MKHIWSHPGVPLIHHLRQVADECERLAKKLYGTEFGLGPHLPALCRIAGACHDIAKATRYFQAYIRNPHKVHSHLKNHAHPSAIIAFWLAERYLQQQNADGLLQIWGPLFVYTAVRRHHGNLNDLSADVALADADVSDLKDQFAAMPEEAGLMLGELLGETLTLPEWPELMDELQSDAFHAQLLGKKYLKHKRVWGKIKPEEKLLWFYGHQAIYGCLLQADKQDVIVGERQGLPGLPFKAINEYREENGWNEFKKGLRQKQNQAYFESLQNLEKVYSPEQHFYSITLPTGLGKTVTSMALAMKLAELSAVDDPRIIVCIPFTCIIDQNAQVYRDILGEGSDMFLTHHHRAEPAYKTSEDELDEDKSQFMIETWQSRVVATTFVQLMETLFSANKSMLLKLPAFANAIVVLDEVQQIPWKYWKLFNKACHALSQLCGTRFILLTATQPLIFTPGEEITELVPDYGQYFRFFNRTRLHNKLNTEVSKDAFWQDIMEYGKEHKDKDLLVIVNTKRTVRETYAFLKDNWGDGHTTFRFLSTYVTPRQRKKVIDEVKNKKYKGRLVLITTQLIEAGVDISMGAVFREQAPLDSIIQAAGRANRYNKQDREADVFLYKIKEWKSGTSKVYGGPLLDKTKSVLKHYAEIPEKDYLQIIQAYFKEVRQFADNADEDLLNNMAAMEFGEVGKFEFIEERETDSVFVLLDHEAQEVWDRYATLMEDGKLKGHERKKAFRPFRNFFYDHVINVPVKDAAQTVGRSMEKQHGFFVIEVGEFYDEEMGFIIPEKAEKEEKKGAMIL